MDSISQAALGSAVVLATLGRRTAAWKAALWGAAAGTLPDLDAFIDHGDPLLNMVRHRAESHGLALLALASAPLGWLAARFSGQPDLWRRWWMAMALALITHPLLDTLTVYGTQLLQPFSNHPFAVGSVFIIDPFYTLPLLLGVLVAVLWSSTKGMRWNAAMLALSTAYLGWSVLAQQHVRGVLEASLRHNGMAASQMLVTPAPFSTVLWPWGRSTTTKRITPCWMARTPLPGHPIRAAPICACSTQTTPMCNGFHGSATASCAYRRTARGGSPSPTCAWGWSPAIPSTSTSARPTLRRARQAQWFSNGSALIFRWPCPGCGAA